MQIHWVGFGDISEAQRLDAEGRIGLLGVGHDDLIDVRFSGQTTRHHQHGAQEVRITCNAHGHEIVVTRTRPDIGLALDEALDAFEREVQRRRDRRRDLERMRPPEPPYLGIVDRVFRKAGYGFILTDGGERVYFHRNAVKAGLDFDRLAEADRVALNVEEGREGPQATAVVAPPPDAPAP